MRLLTSWYSDWAFWFAWFPVRVWSENDSRLLEGTWVWLETIKRRRHGACWEYRLC